MEALALERLEGLYDYEPMLKRVTRVLRDSVAGVADVARRPPDPAAAKGPLGVNVLY